MASIDRRALAAYRQTLDRVCAGAGSAVTDALGEWLAANPGASIAEIREAAIALTDAVLGTYGDAASTLACDLFDSIMELEGVGLPAAQVYGGVREDAVEGTVRRIVGDVDDTQESRDTFMKAVGQLAERETRLAANTTIEENVERAAKTRAGRNVRYARVPTRAVPCEWCAMLASRGFVYRSAEKAEAASHHHCTCTIVPGVKGKTQVSGYDPDHYADVWQHRERFESTEGMSEHERMYGVRYDEAQTVSRSFIYSDEYAAKFWGVSGNKAIDEKLLDAARHALEHNSGTNNESMTFIDMLTGESMTVDCDIPGGIFYTPEVRDFIDSRRNGEPRIACVHNHPNGTPPSADDLSKMAENNYYLGMVAGHNGQVYTYDYHGRTFSPKELDDIAFRISQLCQFGYDVDRAYSLVFDEIGMVYEVR